MRRTAPILIAVAAAAVPVAQAAKPPKPPKPSPGATLSAGVAPTPIVFSHMASVSGKLSGTNHSGVSVRQESMAWPYTGAWVARGSTVTTSSGSYAFSVSPAVSTRYRITTMAAPAVVSASTALGIRWQVGLTTSSLTPRRGAHVRFSGRVHPAHAGGSVLLQKLTSSGYRTVARSVLQATTPTVSSYALRATVRSSATYRVRIPGDGAHLTGTSRLRTLTVR